MAKPEKILIAGDEQDIPEALVFRPELLGHEVLKAVDGKSPGINAEKMSGRGNTGFGFTGDGPLRGMQKDTNG